MSEEKSVGKSVSAEEHQRQMRADQPHTRPETRSDAAMDKRDRGRREGSEKGNMEGGGGTPTRGGGSAKAAEDCK